MHLNGWFKPHSNYKNMTEQQAINILQQNYIETSNELKDLVSFSKYQSEQLTFLQQRLADQEHQAQAEIGEILSKTEQVIDKLEAEKADFKEKLELATEKIGHKENEIKELYGIKKVLWVN